ncbi:hypothetical protein [Brevundimonas sp. 'scallop']|uniref:hypothetical protein n=1 Tax=Brevundimonas sp. 'scallop' TaxID=2562582 RepID=UPI0013E0F000|nr:hypothetical protein [Brevundimonas sp. 'scallop']QIF80421.1 hypothetical protein E4341_01260 [Brevundimonas sp. 'scallop']
MRRHFDRDPRDGAAAQIVKRALVVSVRIESGYRDAIVFRRQNLEGVVAKISRIAASRLGLGLLGVLWLTGCQSDDRRPSLIGYWYAVEVDGEPAIGSRVEMRLPDLNSDTMKASTYRLSIGCEDWGRLDQSRSVLISDALDPFGKSPQAQCDLRDPARLDALRQMTHEGVFITVDPMTLKAVLSTKSGRTARFDFMDMTPVD